MQVVQNHIEPDERSKRANGAILFCAAAACLVSLLTIRPGSAPSVHALRLASASLSALGLLLAIIAFRAHRTRVADCLPPTGVQRRSVPLASWMLAYSAVAYGLAALSVVGDPARHPYVTVQSTLEAMQLFGLGIAIFTLVNAVGSPRGRDALAQSLARRFRSTSLGSRTQLASTPRLAIVYISGVAAVGMQAVALNQFGYLGGQSVAQGSVVPGWSSLLAVMASIRYVAIVGMASRLFRADLPDRSIAALAVVLCIEVPLGLASGEKQAFVLTALAVGLPWLMYRRRVPWTAILISLVFFVMVVTPFVTNLRAEVRSDSERLSVGSALHVAGSRLSGIVDEYVANGFPRGSLTQVVRRIRSTDSFALIIKRTPGSFDYRSKSELVAAPVTALVPRALWRGKPLRLSGLEFYRTYYDGLGESSAAVTMQGSLYLYGGPLVVFVGMFCLGGLVRLLDDVLVRGGPLLAAVGSFVLFVPVVKQELPVADFLASIPTLAATILLGLWLIAVRRNSPQGAHR